MKNVKDYTQIEMATEAYKRLFKYNPDIAGEAYASTLERITKGVSEDFRADFYFAKVFKLKRYATPKEKGRNNLKEVNLFSIDLEGDSMATPYGCIADTVACEVDEGFEEVDERISLKENVLRLKDEVELNNLGFDTLLEALENRFEDPFTAVTLSSYITIPEISELLMETLQYTGALEVLKQYTY